MGYYMKHKKLKKNKKRIYLIFASIILIVIAITISYGRYIYNGLRNYYLSTKSFYFNSDKMSENESYYQLDNWSGVEPVTITFNMDSKKNNLVELIDEENIINHIKMIKDGINRVKNNVNNI